MHPWIRRRLALALLACAPLAAEIRSLTILHTNDLHARMMPLENHHGGFAYLAAVIRRERAGCTDCILLNAGDVAQGTPVSTIFHGLPVFEVANLFGYDVGHAGQSRFRLWLDAGAQVHADGEVPHRDPPTWSAPRASCSPKSLTSSSMSTDCASP